MKRVKFGDIVREVKVQVDRNNNPYLHYVAGDHMDSMDLTIRRKGSFATDDVGPAFIRIFKPGQVLYGSRRTYLKKIAVADFEGICSNTTFVLETKDSNVFLQELLPFVMLSESFTKWSISHSKGSTNPYVLFSDLANYEFTLPSLFEQKVLADKLWAAYRVKESYKKLLAATDDMLKAKFQDMFGEEEKIKIGDAFTTTSGGTPNSKITHYYSGGTIPWLTSGEVRQGYIHSTESYITEEGLANSSAKWIPESSVVIAMYGATIGNVGITNIPLTTNQAICSILPNNKYDQVFVYYAVKNKTDWMKSQSRGAAQPNISQAIIKQMEIPLPPLPLQQQFVEIATQAEATKESLRKSIENIDQVIKSLINQ